MDTLGEEILNIIKGSNMKLKMFTAEGQKTVNAEEATRFYAYEADLMVTVREDEGKIETVIQAGGDFSIPDNKKLLNTIKKATHKNLGEFTVRKFDKKLEPKDFSHQSVNEADFDFDKKLPKVQRIQMPKDPNAGKPLGKMRVSQKTSMRTDNKGNSSFDQSRTIGSKDKATYSRNQSSTQGGKYSYANTSADNRGNFSLSKNGKTTKGYDKAISTALNRQRVNASEALIIEGFSKPFGTVKTSYVESPNARLVIKHTKGVNEEVRGSRSRHIHSLFIENSQGERFRFPHRYMGGAKAMAMHVNEGGTPYDAKGEAILSMCEEIASLNKFVRHVQSNKLVNENNSEIVEAVRTKLSELKNTINSLSTLRGYNNFAVSENNSENTEKSVDITEKFLYNTFTTEELNDVLSRVGRIVAEKQERDSVVQETIKKLYSMIETQTDIGLSLNENDPEHPNNHVIEEQDILARQLSYLANNVTNENAREYFNSLHNLVAEGVSANDTKLIEAIVKYLNTNPTFESQKEIPLDEGVLLTLRKKVQ
tara:strand:+ start:797 stop:2410 length:1614 start_codon:yes stop_codon:yes gene_type:complete